MGGRAEVKCAATTWWSISTANDVQKTSCSADRKSDTCAYSSSWSGRSRISPRVSPASSSIQQHPTASASILNNRREAATGRRRQQIGSSPSRAIRNEDIVVFTARHAPSKSIIHSIPILIDNLALSSMQMTLVLHIGAMAWLNDVERRCRRFIRVNIKLVKFIAILNSTSNLTLEDWSSSRFFQCLWLYPPPFSRQSFNSLGSSWRIQQNLNESWSKLKRFQDFKSPRTPKSSNLLHEAWKSFKHLKNSKPKLKNPRIWHLRVQKSWLKTKNPRL